MRLISVVGCALALLFVASAVATPNPASVTVAGSLQSELGCAADWDPGCATTHLTYDAGDDVWQGVWAVPAGGWEYKAALNNSWDESYGLGGDPDGGNIPLSLTVPTVVKFYYDHKSHWITDSRASVIATAAGSFQSELGCPADWDPGCLRSWLQDPSDSGTYSFTTTALPKGDYETKAAINEGWDESYGQGGDPLGGNIEFNVPSDGARIRFSYDSTTHVLTVGLAAPTATNDTYTTNEATQLAVTAPGVLENDSGTGTLTAVLVSGPSHGALTLNSNGSFTYTPTGLYNGRDSFTYKANDGTNDSNTATASITVTAGAGSKLVTLYDAVKNTKPGKALGDKVKQIQAYLAANDKVNACAGLNNFTALVNAQKIKKLTPAQVTDFIGQANAIKTTLGC
jgi:hypothetical protein